MREIEIAAIDLPGPSRRITVEPIKAPAPVRPSPPVPERKPERAPTPPAPAREPDPRR